MKRLLLGIVLGAAALHAQPEGIWQGYDGEWGHVSRQLIALAEAIPQEKFSWRPSPGVRSTSEVYMHIALANFYLLSATGPKMPDGLSRDMEKDRYRESGGDQLAKAVARCRENCPHQS
jgi:hypothetical protein